MTLTVCNSDPTAHQPMAPHADALAPPRRGVWTPPPRRGRPCPAAAESSIPGNGRSGAEVQVPDQRTGSCEKVGIKGRTKRPHLTGTIKHALSQVSRIHSDSLTGKRWGRPSWSSVRSFCDGFPVDGNWVFPLIHSAKRRASDPRGLCPPDTCREWGSEWKRRKG